MKESKYKFVEKVFIFLLNIIGGLVAFIGVILLFSPGFLVGIIFLGIALPFFSFFRNKYISYLNRIHKSYLWFIQGWTYIVILLALMLILISGVPYIGLLPALSFEILGYFIHHFFYSPKGIAKKKAKLAELERLENRKIVVVELLEHATTYKTKGGFFGAVLGYSLTDKNKLFHSMLGSSLTQRTEIYTVRFMIHYDDGSKELEDVRYDSKRYHELIQYC